MWTKLQLSMMKLLQIGNPVVKVVKVDQSIKEDQITSLQAAANGLETVLKKILGPILTIIGVAAILYAVYLGVMYAKAESADKRKEVQGRLIGACIGAVIIIAGATLCFALNWAQIYHGFAAPHTWIDANNDGWCDTCAK